MFNHIKCEYLSLCGKKHSKRICSFSNTEKPCAFRELRAKPTHFPCLDSHRFISFAYKTAHLVQHSMGEVLSPMRFRHVDLPYTHICLPDCFLFESPKYLHGAYFFFPHSSTLSLTFLLHLNVISDKGPSTNIIKMYLHVLNRIKA